jgi:hypothetical protein
VFGEGDGSTPMRCSSNDLTELSSDQKR